MNKRILYLALFLIQISISHSFAQNYSQLSKSDTISIDSKVFQTKRKVIVTKPLKIGNSDKNSNVILYLDANDKNINGTLLQTADNLINTNEIPKSYLIGIIQEARNTELLEKSKLLKFLTDELIPFLENKYSISKQMTIVGHSFGAYFATYAFLSNNSIFNSCVAISPAYWANDGDVFSLMKEKIKINALTGSFYLAIGDKRWDDISLRNDVFKSEQLLKQVKKLRFGFTDLKGFSHNATPTVGYGLGLGFVYDEWEWENILTEQNGRLLSFPGFWGHLEIKGDALYHLNKKTEAKTIFEEALIDIPKDEDLSNKEKIETEKRIKEKIKSCSLK